MSRRRNSSARGTATEKGDPVLRLAVAATALGMTMGIAPATVLAAGEAEAAVLAPVATADGTARKPDATYHKVELRQAAGTQAKPDGVIQKYTRPDVCCMKFRVPRKEEPASAEAKQPAASGQPVKPGYDVATTKK